MSHKPRKRFGQHFLTDISVLSRISSAIQRTDKIDLIEIGPGQGALTEYLLPASSRLTVIELDRDLVTLLEKRFAGKLNIVSADILNVNLEEVISTHNLSDKVTVVGNLPYNISTPLIFHLLQQRHRIHDMVFMLQKEVAVRICAQPGNKQYGRLSVMTSLFMQNQVLFDVPPESFNPPPKVDSTVIRMTPRDSGMLIKDLNTLDNLVKQAFSQRRKTIGNSLKKMLTTEQFEIADIDMKRRPETLTAEEFVQLSNTITTQ